MADYSQTIVNSVNLFGVAPSNKWSEYNWGSFTWGEGNNDLPVYVVKLLSDSVVLTEAYAPSRYAVVSISESITVTHGPSSEKITDGSGYTYVFPDRATDAEDRDFATWTTNTVTALTWTSQAVGSTTWS